MKGLLKNKDGKAGVIIIILAVIILIALVPWYFIIMGNLDEMTERNPAQSDESDTPDDDSAEDEEIYYEPDYPPEPEQEIEQGAVIELPPVEIVTDISTVHSGLRDELNEIAAQYNAAAVSLTIYDGESGEFFTYGYGHADLEDRRRVDEDTKFRIASLAKLTTVICAMTLVDKYLLDLDMDISIYLGYEVRNSNYPDSVITTRMLMQHTSSIFDSGAFQVSRDKDTSESVRYLLERGTSFRRNRPGSNFEYSNFGYAIIGAICENVAGKSLDTFARDVLFSPLGIDAGYIPSKMHDTENIAVIYNDKHSVTRTVQSQLNTEESTTLGHDLHLAQGNLTISVVDYARILAMLGNGGVLGDVRILSQQAARDINNADVEGAAYKQGLATRYSFGDFIPSEGFYWHTGSAYGLFSQYLYSANDNVNRGIVVATTGATSGRESNGMVSVCTKLAAAAWRELEALKGEIAGFDHDEPDEDD